MYQISPSLHCCVVAGTPVFLDENRGRYFMVAGETGNELAGYLSGSAAPALPQCLVDVGLLNDVSSFSLHSGQLPNALSEASGATAISPMLAFRALLMHRAARRFVRRSGFRQVTTRMRQLAGDEATRGNEKRVVTLPEITRAFAAARTLVQTDKQCVPLSLAIAGMMRMFGHRATFVIGVQLPIAAHCWVQCGDIVIGDTVERTRMFTPIFAT